MQYFLYRESTNNSVLLPEQSPTYKREPGSLGANPRVKDKCRFLLIALTKKKKKKKQVLICDPPTLLVVGRGAAPGGS